MTRWRKPNGEITADLPAEHDDIYAERGFARYIEEVSSDGTPEPEAQRPVSDIETSIEQAAESSDSWLEATGREREHEAASDGSRFEGST